MRKKARVDANRAWRYIDIEAAANSDVEDDDEESESELLANEDLQAQSGEEYLLYRQPLGVPDGDLARIGREITEKYGPRAQRYISEVDQADVPQVALLPTIHDALLWMVPVRRMEERNAVYNLLLNSMASSQRWKILSAFSRPSLPGRIYIEAKSERDVCEACRAQAGVFLRDIACVPIEEALSLLTLSIPFFSPQVGSWVRIASGLYRGDLAYVLAVKNQVWAKVALVPRLPLDGKKRRRAAREKRPPRRLFDPDDVAKAYGPDSVEKCNQRWKFQEETYKNGLLEKQFILEDFVQELATPTVAELLEFRASGGVPSKDLSCAFTQISNSSLSPGDRVEITAGQWAGAVGVVHAISGAAIQVLPSEAGASENTLDVPAIHVARHFRPGDFVRVRLGQGTGKTGWVVSCHDSVVTLHEPSSAEEVKVLVRDLDFHQERPDAVPGTSTQAARHDPKDPLVGRPVVVIQGPCKDYRGTIKDINHLRGVAIVELEATVRKSMFKFQELTVLDPDGALRRLQECPIPIAKASRSGTSAPMRPPIPLSTTPLMPSTPIPTDMFTESLSPAWDPSSRTPGRPDGEAESDLGLWLADHQLHHLKMMVTFTKDWAGGTLLGRLGFTVPSSNGGSRTHVDVQMRNRLSTVHRNIPIQSLVPVRPAGPKELVVVIKGDSITGDVLLVDKMSEEGLCILTTPDTPHEPFTAVSKEGLAVINKR